MMPNFRSVLIPIILLTQVTPVWAADAAPNNGQGLLMQASDMKFHPAPGFPKGAQIVLLQGDLTKAVPYTIRFRLPDGYIIPSHFHSLDEEVTVLSGILNVGNGDKVDKSSSIALTTGAFQVVPANAHHYVWTTGETVWQIDGIGPRTTTFVNPEEWTAMIKASNK